MTKIIGGSIPKKEHTKLTVEDTVSAIFDRLVFAKAEITKDVRSDCMFMPHEMGPMWVNLPETQGDEIDFFPPEDVNSPDLVWPMGCGMASMSFGHPEWGNHVQCVYFQSVPAKWLRGGWKGVGRKNIGHYIGYLHSGNKWVSAVNYGAWHFGKWRTCQKIRYNQAFFDVVKYANTAPLELIPSVGEDDIGQAVALGQSMALTYRYRWGAQFSIGNSVRLIVPVTPRGILELFNDRDKPQDRDRRAALRHWVSQHVRTVKQGKFTHVRDHLRGNMSFNWRGFDVQILPSQFDEERNAA